MAEAALDELVARVREATAGKTPLTIRSGGTKDFYGNVPRGEEVLDPRGLAGIVAYEPTELVVTARCGTPLAELETLLDA
jgi:glycolate oxidase FAD binding subunit